MGDPKFPRRQYSTPSHPWKKDRIDEENILIKKYGLKNKKELWKVRSLVSNFRQQARSLQARLRTGDQQAEKEKAQLLGRLLRTGFLPDGASLNDILGLKVEALLARRLQSQVYLKGLAYTPKHARQLIVHGHAAIKGHKVTIPGYYVRREEEDLITYKQYSPLDNELHPARRKALTEGEIVTFIEPYKPDTDIRGRGRRRGGGSARVGQRPPPGRGGPGRGGPPGARGGPPGARGGPPGARSGPPGARGGSGQSAPSRDAPAQKPADGNKETVGKPTTPAEPATKEAPKPKVEEKKPVKTEAPKPKVDKKESATTESPKAEDKKKEEST